ncbi:MAG: hypothetical protein GY822_10825 [Deltaproteobacteria bacterium]|nr:hypothetical protein [Deltaproteobacteria bacterium]
MSFPAFVQKLLVPALKLVVVASVAAAPTLFAQDVPLEGSAEDVPLEGSAEDVPLEGSAEDVPLEGSAEDVPLEGAAEDVPLEGAAEDAKDSATETNETPAVDENVENGATADQDEVKEPEEANAFTTDFWLKNTYKRRVGDPTPLTRREPTLKAWQFEADAHYGLVGTGPTRFSNEIRLGITDWFEVRTSLMPWPQGLMGRLKLGEHNGVFGAFLFDGGLAALDAGIRLTPEEGEVEAGVRAYFEAGVAYSRAVGERFAVFASAHARYRASMLEQDDQFTVALDGHVVYDLIPAIALSVGVGYAEAVGTPIRELSVSVAEVGRAGMSHFLLRNDGWSRSVTLPMSLTYGRVESFDVDLFVTPRVYPSFDVLFGAGLRWRFQIFEREKPKTDPVS